MGFAADTGRPTGVTSDGSDSPPTAPGRRPGWSWSPRAGARQRRHRGPSAAPTPAPSPSPTAPPEQTLTVGIAGELVGGLSNAADGVPTARAAAFLYNGLYGYDERLRPVPVLARDVATVSADGLTWTIALRDDVTFHDGTPLTADDVVQTYELARSANCRFTRRLLSDHGPREGRQARRPHRRLHAPLAVRELRHDATRVVDREQGRRRRVVRPFRAGCRGGHGPGGHGLPRAHLGRGGAPDRTQTARVDYEQFRTDGEALLTPGGHAASQRGLPHDRRRARTSIATSRDLRARIRAIDASFTSRPIDALAAAYPYLDFQEEPIGTGPFTFASYDPGIGLELVANEDYFLGAPAIKRVTFRSFADRQPRPEQALSSGDVDWQFPLDDATDDAIEGDPDYQVVEYPELSFLGLYFNLHPESGGLFLDRNLRQALSYCFDKPATATTATDGGGTAIFSEIPPMSWAYPTAGPQRVSDRSRARQGAHRGIGLDARGRRHLREGRPPPGDRRRRPRGVPRTDPLARARRRAGPRVRHRARVQGGPVHVDRADARRLPARQRGGTARRGGRSTRTSVGSTRPWSPIRSGSTTRPSARRRSGRPRSTSSATRILPSTG